LFLIYSVSVQAAGIVGATGVKTEDVDPDNFEAVFRVNVHGIFNGCKAALPYMRENNYGRIVNISSIAGKDGNAGMLAYSASKAAVIGLTKSIGKEYAETGITCNALCPAVVRTQMVDDMPAEQVKYMTDKIPMKRCGTIDEIGTSINLCLRQYIVCVRVCVILSLFYLSPCYSNHLTIILNDRL
jgi:NAD(P)-dependent dehydrogenase (short-subunit alcohol dehydrogenase family)